MKKKAISITLALLLGLLQAGAALAESWQAVPWVTQSMKNADIAGGEGGQWPQAIAVAPSDPNFLMYGSDVGGIFRSTNGGANWEPANMGFDSRGTSGFAIDPFNANRVLAVGANSGPATWNGVYLSTDKGVSWSRKVSANISGFRDIRDQLAYDPSSYDASAGYTKVAYWSRIGTETQQWGSPEIDPAIYRTQDGGSTWTKLANSAAAADSRIKVHPTSGYVYTVNANGFYKSTNQGGSFTQKRTGAYYGIDVVKKTGYENYVWITGTDGLYVSTDSGENFNKVQASTSNPYPPGFIYNLKVSPANPNRMLLVSGEGAYNEKRYYTTDGGVNWYQANYDNSLSVLPYNNRGAVYAWHPTNENVAWSFGGDWITKSTNGGATWTWSNSGNNAIMTGGKFNFNTHDSNLLFVGTQDYNGALTTDGGSTWRYIDINQYGWGGWSYGAYAATSQVIFGTDRDINNFNHRTLRITRDGGTTVTDTGIEMRGIETGYGDPNNANVLFSFNHRSTDQGLTWKTMLRSRGVLTHNPTGSKELYGAYGSHVVRSWDQGASWEKVFELPGGESVSDVAYDHVRHRIYAASWDHKLYKYETTTQSLAEITSLVPADQFGNRRIWSVAVDPVNPNVVYTAGPANIYSSDTSVNRSTDGGATWQPLTRAVRHNNSQFGKDGGREASVIRVNPATRYAVTGSICYGIWTIAPPASASPLPSQAPAPTPGQSLAAEFGEDFNDDAAQNWTLSSTAAVSGKKLRLSNWGGGSEAIYGGAAFNGSYVFSAEVSNSGGANANAAKLLFNYTDANNYYYLFIGGGSSNTVSLHKVQNGSYTTLATYNGNYGIQNNPTTFEIEYAQGGSITVRGLRDDRTTTLFQNVQDSTHASGKIGVATEWNIADFDNIFIGKLSTNSGGNGGSGDGKVAREYWTGVQGAAISDIPVNTRPTGTNTLTSLEGPVNWADNYGTRIRGYIVPPATGSYTFYIAGDDSSELWLSTGASPANKSRIAYVSGWTNSREWTKYASQQSDAKSLTAGQKYYFEILHKEGGGGDNIAVGWTGPGISAITVVGGGAISSYADGQAAREYWTGIGGGSVSSIPLTTAPSGTSTLTSLEGPTDWADNYGTRIRAYIVPSTTGSYTFYLAGDDDSELWLSTDENPANKSRIANVSGWTGSREWTKFASQQSTARTLTAGQRYYVEVLHKEGTGGDNIAVGWTGPGISAITVVGGANLTSY